MPDSSSPSIREEVASILGGDRVVFKPCAYYDKHMDFIRIELRDCSIKEVRINEIITIHRDNNPEITQFPLAGLTIKGVKHLFIANGLPLTGIIEITEILNRLAVALEQAIQNVHEKRLALEAVDNIRSFARQTNLMVDFRAANSNDLAIAA